MFSFNLKLTECLHRYNPPMPQGEYLQYGGQAIIEGVMMRSPRFFSVACRAPNGEIISTTEALETTWIGRQKWLKLPFLRGSLALLDAMALGIKAMRFSANIQIDEKYAKPDDAGGKDPDAKLDPELANVPLQSPAQAVEAKKAPSKQIQDASVAGAMVFGIAFGLFLFVLLPNWLAEGLKRFGVQNPMQLNLMAGLIKIVFFMGYLALIGQMEGIKDVFRYHGAEHKAINALEKGDEELDREVCQAETRFHPRCGTSFAVIVLIVSLFLFTFVPRYPLGENTFAFVNVLVRVALEIVILPFIAGISYELLRLAGKFRNQTAVNMAFKPGIWTQHLTTREPTLLQVDVAIVALKNVLRAEKSGLPIAPHEDVLESAPIP